MDIQQQHLEADIETISRFKDEALEAFSKAKNASEKARNAMLSGNTAISSDSAIAAVEAEEAYNEVLEYTKEAQSAAKNAESIADRIGTDIDENNKEIIKTLVKEATSAAAMSSSLERTAFTHHKNALEYVEKATFAAADAVFRPVQDTLSLPAYIQQLTTQRPVVTLESDPDMQTLDIACQTTFMRLEDIIVDETSDDTGVVYNLNYSGNGRNFIGDLRDLFYECYKKLVKDLSYHKNNPRTKLNFFPKVAQLFDSLEFKLSPYEMKLNSSIGFFNEKKVSDFLHDESHKNYRDALSKSFGLNPSSEWSVPYTGKSIINEYGDYEDMLTYPFIIQVELKNSFPETFLSFFGSNQELECGSLYYFSEFINCFIQSVNKKKFNMPLSFEWLKKNKKVEVEDGMVDFSELGVTAIPKRVVFVVSFDVSHQKMIEKCSSKKYKTKTLNFFQDLETQTYLKYYNIPVHKTKFNDSGVAIEGGSKLRRKRLRKTRRASKNKRKLKTHRRRHGHHLHSRRHNRKNKNKKYTRRH